MPKIKNKLKVFFHNLNGGPQPPNYVPPSPPRWLPTPSGGEKNRALQAKVVGMEVVNRTKGGANARYDEALRKGLNRLQERYELLEEEAVFLATHIAKVLDESSLTININGKGWFAQPNDSTAYTQMFERHKMTIAGLVRDVAIQTPSGVPRQRDDAERAKLLQVGAGGPRPRGQFLGGAVGRFADTGGMNPVKGTPKFVAENTAFVGSSRPRYAALNYANSPNGAVGCMYGKSCLVLHDWLKDRATFCAGDSFAGWVKKDTLCTQDTIAALIAWAPDPILEHLVDVVLGEPKPSIKDYLGTKEPGMYFIEAHMYQEVDFATCVKALHLSLSETGMSFIYRKHAADFCNRYGIALHFVA